MSIYETLAQDEVWVDAQDKVYPLSSLSPRYRATILVWLERSAALLQQFRIDDKTLHGIRPRGDAACDAFDSMLAQVSATPPLRWLYGFPCVQALVQLIHTDEKRDPVPVGEWYGDITEGESP